MGSLGEGYTGPISDQVLYGFRYPGKKKAKPNAGISGTSIIVDHNITIKWYGKSSVNCRTKQHTWPLILCFLFRMPVIRETQM